MHSRVALSCAIQKGTPAFPGSLVALRCGGSSFHFCGLAAVRVEPIQDILKCWGDDAALVASRHLAIFDLHTKLLTHFNHHPRTPNPNGTIIIALNPAFWNLRHPHQSPAPIA